MAAVAAAAAASAADDDSDDDDDDENDGDDSSSIFVEVGGESILSEAGFGFGSDIGSSSGLLVAGPFDVARARADLEWHGPDRFSVTAAADGDAAASLAAVMTSEAAQLRSLRFAVSRGGEEEAEDDDEDEDEDEEEEEEEEEVSSSSPSPKSSKSRSGRNGTNAATTSRVCAKSSSVSPGKPTMMSVVIAASGMATRTRSMMPRYFSRR